MATYLDSEHQFHYNTTSPVTAEMLAESLLGLQGIVKRSTDVLERLLDTRITDADVLITAIAFGSVDENFIIRFFFGKGKAGERNIERLRKQLGLKNMDLKKAVGIILAGTVALAGYHFVTASPKDDNATIHFENCFNNWGKDVGMTKGELLALFQTAIQNKEDLKRQSIKLAHPAGNQDSGTITFDNDESLSLPPEVTKAIPAKYVQEPAAEPSTDFEKEDVVIRAVDLDRPETGWAAIVPTVSDKRLPIQLEDGIDPMTVPIGRIAIADITVFYKVGVHGNKTPCRYLVRKLYKRADPSTVSAISGSTSQASNTSQSSPVPEAPTE